MHARVSAISPSKEAAGVVLVHGLGVSGRYMIPLAEKFSTFYPGYVSDLPGFGRT